MERGTTFRSSRAAPPSSHRAKACASRNATGEILPSPARRQHPAKLGVQDCVVVSVKGQSLPEVGQTIAPLLGAQTSIVTAMNGVPWWFFDKLAYGAGKLRLASLDPGGKLSAAMPTGRIVGCVIHAPPRCRSRYGQHDRGNKIMSATGRLVYTWRTACDRARFDSGFECLVTDSREGFWYYVLGNVSFNRCRR